MGFDINKIMKQAQKMQNDMAAVQDELAKVDVTGSAGGGAVVITADGRGEVKAIKISPDALDDAETLEELVLAAIKDAAQKASDLAQERMSGVTQGLKLPGMPF